MRFFSARSRSQQVHRPDGAEAALEDAASGLFGSLRGAQPPRDSTAQARAALMHAVASVAPATVRPRWGAGAISAAVVAPLLLIGAAAAAAGGGAGLIDTLTGSGGPQNGSGPGGAGASPTEAANNGASVQSHEDGHGCDDTLQPGASVTPVARGPAGCAVGNSGDNRKNGQQGSGRGSGSSAGADDSAAVAHDNGKGCDDELFEGTVRKTPEPGGPVDCEAGNSGGHRQNGDHGQGGGKPDTTPAGKPDTTPGGKPSTTGNGGQGQGNRP